MKKSPRIIAILITLILITGGIIYFGGFGSTQNTYFASSERGVVLVTDNPLTSMLFSSTPKLTQQTAFIGGTCPSGTTTPYCSSIAPTKYFQCSGGVTNSYTCPEGQFCNGGKCQAPQCPSGTTTPYCSDLKKNGYFQCSNGVVSSYTCKDPSAVCKAGVGCYTPTTTQPQCPSGTTNYYCSSIDPTARYKCDGGTTYKYICASGSTCSNGQCVSSTSVPQTSSPTCPTEKFIASVTLSDTAKTLLGVQKVICDKWVKYTKSGSSCIAEPYCKNTETFCLDGYVIKGTKDTSGVGALNCELNVVEMQDTGTVPLPDQQNAPSVIDTSCKVDVTTTCDDGHTIIVRKCESGIYTDTSETCIVQGTGQAPSSGSQLGTGDTGTIGGSQETTLQDQETLQKKGSSYIYLFYLGLVLGVILLTVFLVRKRKKRRK